MAQRSAVLPQSLVKIDHFAICRGMKPLRPRIGPRAKELSWKKRAERGPGHAPRPAKEIMLGSGAPFIGEQLYAAAPRNSCNPPD
jgi:hypothetical protein